MVQNKKWILSSPIIFSLAWILFNYLWVYSQEKALSGSGQYVLADNRSLFLLSNLLILMPNLLLCFLLWTYMKTSRASAFDLLLLCAITTGCGFAPQLFLSITYYELWYQAGMQLSLIVYGFPFVYLIGMMIGWVIGLTVVSIKNG